MTAPIRGLTLRHPWSWAFTDLGKDVENRSWYPQRQGGELGMYLALHGGSSKLSRAYGEEITEALEWMAMLGLVPMSAPEQPASLFVREGIVAVAQLAGVTERSASPWAASGQVHWVLADVTPIEPVPHRGAQGFWQLEPQTLAMVRERYRAAALERVR